jgi:hypothetical protein
MSCPGERKPLNILVDVAQRRAWLPDLRLAGEAAFMLAAG